MSGKYDAGRDAFADGRLSWTRDKIVAHLVSAAYVFSAKHTDRRDLKGLVGDPVVLTGRSVSAGWVRAAAMTFKQVSGADVVGVIIRRDVLNDDKGSTLLAYLNEVDRFPMKTNGGDIEIRPPEQGLFRV